MGQWEQIWGIQLGQQEQIWGPQLGQREQIWGPQLGQWEQIWGLSKLKVNSQHSRLRTACSGVGEAQLPVWGPTAAQLLTAAMNALDKEDQLHTDPPSPDCLCLQNNLSPHLET